MSGTSTNLLLDLENNAEMKVASKKPRNRNKRSVKQNDLPQIKDAEQTEESQFIAQDTETNIKTVEESTTNNKLKKPLSSYMRWLTDNREILTNSYKENLQPNQKYRSSDFIVYAGACWRGLPAEKRLFYIERAREALRVYKMTTNNPSLDAISKPIATTSSSPPDISRTTTTVVETNNLNDGKKILPSHRNSTIAKVKLPVSNRVRNPNMTNKEQSVQQTSLVDGSTDGVTDIENVVCENGSGCSMYNSQNKVSDSLTESSFNSRDLSIFPKYNAKSKSNKKK